MTVVERAGNAPLLRLRIAKSKLRIGNNNARCKMAKIGKLKPLEFQDPTRGVPYPYSCKYRTVRYIGMVTTVRYNYRHYVTNHLNSFYHGDVWLLFEFGECYIVNNDTIYRCARQKQSMGTPRILYPSDGHEKILQLYVRESLPQSTEIKEAIKDALEQVTDPSTPKWISAMVRV